MKIMSQGRRALSQQPMADGTWHKHLKAFFGGTCGPCLEASKMAPTPKLIKAAKAAQKSAAQQQLVASQIPSPRMVSDSAPPLSPGFSASPDQGLDLSDFLRDGDIKRHIWSLPT